MWFRQAKMADADLLLAWRNDPLTRQMSRNQDVVEMDGHVAWLSKRLSRVSPQLHMVMMMDERIGNFAPVATFRIDGDELSYTVAPEHRGKGIAKQMLAKIRADARRPLTAEIKRDNMASIRAAESAGHTVVLID